MRLVDADAILAHMADWYCYDDRGSETTLKQVIENAPTVESDEVVRCNECKYEEKCEREVMWKNDSYRGILTFCSYGERRTGNTE